MRNRAGLTKERSSNALLTMRPTHIEILQLELITLSSKRDAIDDRHADELVIIKHPHERAAPIKTGVEQGGIVRDLPRWPAVQIEICRCQYQVAVVQTVDMVMHFTPVNSPYSLDLCSLEWSH